MEIIFSPKAEEHLQYWKKTGDKRTMQKIENLLESIVVSPFEGIGKPEPLKHEFSGFWSRRITQEHRLVYRVSEDKIEVASLRFHY